MESLQKPHRLGHKMTDKLRAAAELALEAIDEGWLFEDIGKTVAPALRQALAEPDTGIDRGAWSDVEDATQWVDELRGNEPDLLNQTCNGCGLSGGYALYCGWCWRKGDKPVDDVNTTE